MSINPTPSVGPPGATFSGSPFGDSMAPLSANLFVTVNTGLMGQPFGNNQGFASSDASALGSAPAQAGGPTGESLLTGDAALLASSTPPGNDSQATIVDPAQVTVAPVSAINSQLTAATPDVKTNDGTSEADARAVTQSEWLANIGSLIQTWLAPSRPDVSREGTGAARTSPELLAANERSAVPIDPADSSRNQQFQPPLRGDMGAATGLVIVGAIGYGMKRPIRKWWRQCGQLASPALHPAPKGLAGPSTHQRISRVTTRVRMPLQPQ
jgi:hypothetical protein